MAISAVKKCTVFYNPEVTHLNVLGFTEGVLPDSTTSDAATYRIQMININSQSDQVLDINITNSSEEDN